MSYWRRAAAPIIAEVLIRTDGPSETEIQKALTAAYPFGERAHWPYKVWLDEVKRQRKIGKVKQHPLFDSSGVRKMPQQRPLIQWTEEELKEQTKYLASKIYQLRKAQDNKKATNKELNETIKDLSDDIESTAAAIREQTGILEPNEYYLPEHSDELEDTEEAEP